MKAGYLILLGSYKPIFGIPEISHLNLSHGFTDVSVLYENFQEQEKKLLKSNSTNAFYIKILDSHSKAFVIDGIKKLIYYICETEFDDKIILKY